MTGQDAANTAKAFNEALPLTGVVLTKVDGDARGGAALSIRHITGKPIKFLGVGEKTEALEPFHPDRVASRILGMGRRAVADRRYREARLTARRPRSWPPSWKKGDGFDLTDFLEQLRQMKNMGGMASLMGKLPGMGADPGQRESADGRQSAGAYGSDHQLDDPERAALSRKSSKGSRKRRIAAGCGMQVAGCEPSAQAVRRHAAHDEEDEVERRHDEDDAWDERDDAARLPGSLKQGHKAILFAILAPGCARHPHVLPVRSSDCAHAGTKLAAPPTAFYSKTYQLLIAFSPEISKIFGLLI
ncbi:Signal recognition particle [Klebsiella pneumoniae]|uniref:Signal recognition particle n=1 Tax=Klebsiella pneumoniae TaxID=573 RepID=A0A3S4H6C0_KLEPN|nr:Signal recognition particle [Klebsiella pneumoniae]